MKRLMSFTLSILMGVAAMNVTSARAQENQGTSFAIKPHHVGISVPDAEASAAWYRKMLGFEVVLRMNEDAANKMKIVHIRRDNCYIELFQVEGQVAPEHRRDPNTDFREHGLKHVAFEVPDVHAAVKELKAKGPRSPTVRWTRPESPLCSSGITRAIRLS